MSDGSAASNGGSDSSSREVLVGEIVAGDAVTSRPTNGGGGSGDQAGEGRDTPPLP